MDGIEGLAIACARGCQLRDAAVHVHVGNRVTHHVNSFTKGYIQQINTKYLIYVGTG